MTRPPHGYPVRTLTFHDGTTLEVTDAPHTDGTAAVTVPEWNETLGEWELVAHWIDTDLIASAQ